MQTIKVENIDGASVITCKPPLQKPPPGECREFRVVPVEEAYEKDARIAELDAKLAERLPGVMPECVKKAIDRLRSTAASYEWDKERADELEAYFATPEGHEWQPVDAEHPITAEDVGRDLLYQPTKISKVYGGGGWTTKGYILRPIAPPFVFTGEPGRYVARWDDNETPEECEICHPHNFPAGTFAALWDDGDWTKVNADGTFIGGRIVGRVGE